MATCLNSAEFVYSMILISKHDTFLCWTEKGGEKAKQQIDREWERAECCSKRVLAWAINLAITQIFMTARERIILDLIKMNIKIISKNLDGIVFSAGHSDFFICPTSPDMSQNTLGSSTIHLIPNRVTSSRLWPLPEPEKRQLWSTSARRTQTWNFLSSCTTSKSLF